jgi:outer membrane protein assembly factor BamB
MVAVLVCLGFGAFVQAQQPARAPANPPIQVAQLGVVTRSSADSMVNVFVPAPREKRLLLSRAQRAVAEDRFSDSVRALGDLLESLESGRDRPAEQAGDYFILKVGSGEPPVSLRTEALRILGSMPSKGLQWYHLQYGAEAQRLLDTALTDGDISKLTEVTRRFFHTPAGYEAAMLLGRYHLDHGRPLAAALHLRRVAEAPAAAEIYEPELSLLLATCWFSAGDRQKAEQTLFSLRQRHPHSKFLIAGAEVPLFPEGGSAEQWLREHVAPPMQMVAGAADRWMMYRGDIQRNASVSGDAPLTNYRWYVPMASHQKDQDQVDAVRRHYLEHRLPALPAMHPLVLEDTVLFRTAWHLFAVDFESGKLKWHYPWNVDIDQQSFDGHEVPSPGIVGPRMNFIQQRTWQDAPYGQLSSDGKCVFVIDELGFASTQMSLRTLVQPGGRRLLNPGWPKGHNSLRALDLKQEGKLRWIVGGQTGEETQLADAFFLGPPLAVLQTLYVLAELTGEIQLVALDPDTGRLLWAQQLAHVEKSIDRNILRRLAGASPSFADGIMVCPTSAGAVVAVDVATRSLLWGYQYKHSSTSLRPTIFPTQYSGSPSQPGARWADATVTISGGRVLITPVESAELHCLDLLTGERKWTMPRGDFLFVGCVDKQTVLLVGKDKVQGFRLQDGQPAWDARPLPSASMPSGRGFLSGSAYYLPTTAAELVGIDVSTGQLSKPLRTQGVLGNLVCYENAVISQGVDRVASFYQVDPLRREVARRLEANPDDIWALSRQAEILLYDGRQKEALDVLRKAYRYQPQETRALLVSTLLDVLRGDYASNRELVAEVQQLLLHPEQHEEFLRLTATGLHAAGQRMDAFDAYLKIAGLGRRDAAGAGAADDEGMQQVDAHLEVCRERWLQTQLAEVMGDATDEERRKMRAAIDAQLDAAVQAESSNVLRQFARHFDGQPQADSARLKLAQRLLGQDRLLEAELLLTKAQQSSDPAVAGRATARRAALLTRAEHFDEAAACYRRLAAQWPEVECGDGMTGREWLAAVPADSPVGKALVAPKQWPAHVRATPTKETGRRLSSHTREYPLNILSIDHLRLPGVQAALNKGNAGIIVKDGLGNAVSQVGLATQNRTHIFTSNYMLTRGRFYGHLLVVSFGFDIVALDTLKATPDGGKRELWRKDLTQTLPGARATRRYLRPVTVTNPWSGSSYVARDQQGNPTGMLGPLTDCGITFVRGRALVCVDPIRGGLVWKRNDCTAGSELFGDEEALLVIPPNANAAQLYRTADGTWIRSASVPPPDRRWTSYGRRLLTWTEKPGQMVLRLYDPLTESDTWAYEFVTGSKGWLVEGDKVAVLEPGGKFLMINMADGSAEIETRLRPEPTLQGVYVVPNSDCYMVVTSKTPTETRANISIEPAPSATFSPMVNSRVYAFRRKTGELLWPDPVELDQFSLPLHQPTEIPVLTFLRRIQKTVPGRATKPIGSVLCLDKRTGKVLLRDDEIPALAHSFEIIANREAREISVTLPGKSVVFEFSDEPGEDVDPGEQGGAPSTGDGAATP